MNRVEKAPRIGFSVFGAALLVWATLMSGCASQAARTVADQNTANAAAYAANVSILSTAARELAQAQAAALVQRSRERVAGDLIRVRATITPSAPTDAELDDPGTPWAKSLAAEVGVLGARVNAASPDQRSAAALSLADEGPATIDLAIATPGFTIPRVLHDAAEIDSVNAMIEAEKNAAVRSGLFARRGAILDAYLPAKSASDAADRYRAAVDQLLAKIDEQGRVLGVHAQAIDAYAAGSPHGTVLGALQSPDLRAAAVDLVAQVWGSNAATQLGDQLKRIDAVLSAVDPPTP